MTASDGIPQRKIEDYADIIDLPHHVSVGRKHISPEMRAAQFSPFAALTGYEAVIGEAARLTDEKSMLDDMEKELIELNLRLALEKEDEILLTYFVPDERKSGGRYESVTTFIESIDEDVEKGEWSVKTADGTVIPMENIVSAEI